MCSDLTDASRHNLEPTMLLVFFARCSKVSGLPIASVKLAVFQASTSRRVGADTIVNNIEQGQRPAVVPGPIKQTCADQIVERNRVEHVVDRGDRQPGLFSACRFQWLRPGVEHEV